MCALIYRITVEIANPNFLWWPILTLSHRILQPHSPEHRHHHQSPDTSLKKSAASPISFFISSHCRVYPTYCLHDAIAGETGIVAGVRVAATSYLICKVSHFPFFSSFKIRCNVIWACLTVLKIHFILNFKWVILFFCNKVVRNLF